MSTEVGWWAWFLPLEVLQLLLAHNWFLGRMLSLALRSQ